MAEGQKQSAILAAEGDRQAAIVQAEGFALALQQIYQSAKGLDANTMTLQYFEALKKLGASPATKFVLPMELSGLLAGMTGSFGQSFANGKTVTNAKAVTTNSAATAQGPLSCFTSHRADQCRARCSWICKTQPSVRRAQPNTHSPGFRQRHDRLDYETRTRTAVLLPAP